MFVHIVFFKLLDPGANGTSAADNARELKKQFEGLHGVIPGLRRIDLGIDVFRTAESADIALYTEFDDRAAYDGYVVHPAHQAIVAYLKGNRSERRVVDYEI